MVHQIVNKIMGQKVNIIGDQVLDQIKRQIMDQVVNQLADQIVFHYCPLILFPELTSTEFNIFNLFRLANLFTKLMIISELFTMNTTQWTNKSKLELELT